VTGRLSRRPPGIRELGRIDRVFKNGITFDSKQLRDSLRGKIAR
jgi:hypothetical protein